MIFGAFFVAPPMPARGALGTTAFEIGDDEPSGGSAAGIIGGANDWAGLTTESDGVLLPGEVLVLNDLNYTGSAVVTNPETAAKDLCTNSNDNIVKNGTKIDHYPFETIPGSPSPGKNDVCQTYVSYEVDPNGDVILYLGVIRREIDGTTAVALELNKINQANRQIDDLLVTFEFDGKGPVSDITVRQWNGTKWTVESVSDVDGGSWEHFGEIAVNLTDTSLLPPPVSADDCTSFSNVLVYGFAGNSSNSNVGDFGGSSPVDIPLCGQLKLTKVATPAPASSLEFGWLLEDKSGTFADLSGFINHDQTITLGLVDGEYALSEPEIASLYSLDRIECSDADGSVAPGAIAIARGTSVSCTIYNVASQLIVGKRGSGDDSAAFPFTVTGQSDFDLGLGDDSATFTFAPGTNVTIAETLPGGNPSWEADGAECRDSQGALVASSNGPSVDVGTIAGKLITCIFTNTQDGAITVVKHVVNNYGGEALVGDFALYLDGQAVASGATSYVDPGIHTVSEDDHTGYTQTDLVCRDDDSQADVGHPVELDPGQFVTCTITNTDNPAHLTLRKTVVNNSGGEALDTEWTLTAEGSVTISGSEGEASVTDAPIAAGTYDLSEAGPSGYSQVGGWSCQGGQMVDGDTVSIGLAETVVCTVTNNDQAPRLTLVKNLVSDNGGNATLADFILTADGPTLITGTSGTPPVTNAKAYVGTYDLSESGPAGYAQDGGWVCLGGTQDGDSISLGLGESATCTVTNDDVAPELTVIKKVNNDDGGNAVAGDFQLYLNASPVEQGVSLAGIVSNTDYTLSEDAVDGYIQTSLSCVDDDTEQAVAHPVNLDEGQSVTCTIINDDVAPELTVIKEVSNDDGGNAVAGDFQLYVNGEAAAQGETLDVDANTEYTVSEDAVDGYTQTSLSCTDDDTEADVPHPVTLDEGQSVTCTVTNDDVAPLLTLEKVVINDDGGFAVDSDWTLWADGPASISGVEGDDAITAAPVPAGSYDLTETGGFHGYDQIGWSCGDHQMDGTNTVTLSVGDVVTCTVTNDDRAPKIRLRKTVINDDGGDADDRDWLLHADGPISIAGHEGDEDVTGRSVPAGVYDLSESSGPVGYVQSGDWVCQGGTQIDGDTVSLRVGQYATCYITNDDAAASLTLVKEVLTSGEALPDDFGLTITPDGEAPMPTLSGETHELSANQTYTVGETLLEGWEQLDLVCEDQDGSVEHPVALALGQHVRCTITNAEVPSITVIKTTEPESADLFSFTLNPGDTQEVAGNGGTYTWDSLEPGGYELTESAPADWSLESFQCDGEVGLLESGVSIDLGWGDHITCIFGNGELGSITVVKETDIETDELFQISVASDLLNDLVDLGSGDSHTWDLLAPGTYTVEEAIGNLDWTIGLSCAPETLQAEIGAQTIGAGGEGTRARAAVIELGFGDHITCTFVNQTEQADLEVTKVDLIDPVILSDENPVAQIEYLVTVTNNGPAAARNATAVDTLPDSLTFISATPSAGTCDHSSGIITCDLGDMASGDVVTISIVAQTQAIGEVTEGLPRNVVEVGSETIDPNPDNNTDDEVTAIDEILPLVVLPFTGIDAGRLVALALAMVALGLGVLATSRRREDLDHRPYPG